MQKLEDAIQLRLMRRWLPAGEFRSVFALAAPIAVMQAGMVLYGTVATVFAGRLGAEAIACVGLAGSTYFMLFILALGILLGIDPLSSQAFGAGRRDDCAEVLAHAIPLALVVAVPIFLALSVADRIFAFAGIVPSVAETTAAYLKVLRWALFPALLFAACRQYLQTMDITRPQLTAVVASNLLNALLGYALIFGCLGRPGMGVFGAAYAMLAANVLMFAVVGAAAWREVREARYSFRGFRPSLFRELLRVGAPAGLQMLAEVGAFSCATMLSGRLGATAAAAHQIALNLASMSFMVPLGISFAAAVRVGQGIGGGRPKSAARSGYAALGLGVAFMCLTSLAYFFLPGPILRLYTTDPAVAALGLPLLAVAAIFQVFDATQVVMTGSLRGLGETRIPMAANAVGHWLIGLPVGIYLAFRAGWGVLGLWFGLCLGICLVALTLLWVWARGARSLA